ncbi:MAG: hypothetical protein GKR87_01715 [Kiritimatiellae bacterium]|nr:hypothetical protein [Kiritimatiellia bacterium]
MKDNENTLVGPGPNYFSDSTNNVWVDANGYLHLKIDQRGGTNYTAEIFSQQSLGHGRYSFFVDGRIDNYGTNVVAGLFTYDSTFPDGSTNEIDIEFTKAFVKGNNAIFSSHPVSPGDAHSLAYIVPTNTLTMHSFTWFTNQIDFKSQNTHDLLPAQSDIFSQFIYTGPNIPVSQGTEKVRLNLWLLEGAAPVDTQNLELVVRDFQFTETKSVLFDFEDPNTPVHANNWFFFQASGLGGRSSDSYQGTNAMFISDDESTPFGGAASQPNPSIASIPITNWAPYDQIRYWVKSSTNVTSTFRIKCIESDGEHWKQSVDIIPTTNYQEIVLGLDNFVFDPEVAAVNGIFDRTNVLQVIFLVFPAGHPTAATAVDYLVDDVTFNLSPVDSGETDTNSLFNFETGTADWFFFSTPNGEGGNSSPLDAHGGFNAMRIPDNLDGNANGLAFGGATITSNDIPIRDWSPHNYLTYWTKTTENDIESTIHIEFNELPLHTNEALAGDKWTQVVNIPVSTNYTQIELSLDCDFTRNGGSSDTNIANGLFDPADIAEVVFVVLPARHPDPTNSVDFFVDDVEFSSTSTLPALPSNILYNFEPPFWNQGFKKFSLGATIDLTQDPNNLYDGGVVSTQALEASFILSNTTVGVFNDCRVPISDWSSYNQITYWIKKGSGSSGEDSNATVRLKVREGSGEAWWQTTPTELAVQAYEQVQLDFLSEFSYSESFDNGVFDLTNITEVTFVFEQFPRETDSEKVKTYYIDDIELTTNRLPPPPTTLSIEPSSIDFGGNLIASPGNSRFNTLMATATWATVYAGWQIEFYTTNNSHFPVIENSGSSGGSMLWKLTQPNFGGWSTNTPTVPPDPNNQSDWTNFYAFIFNPTNDGAGPGSDGFKSLFGIQSNSPQVHTVPFVIGVEAIGAPTGDYSGTVFFDFVFP